MSNPSEPSPPLRLSAAPASPTRVDPALLDPTDPVRIRLRLLSELDAQIRADAARRHLEARLLMDRVFPIAYLGVDADPEEGGMRLTKVYPEAAAGEAGLRRGDLLTSVAGQVVDAPAKMGNAVRRHRVGDRVEIRFLRDGREHVVSTVLTARVEEDEDEDEQYPELAETGAMASSPVTIRFDGPEGSLPEPLVPALGGHGEPPRYEIVKENGESFLRQKADDRTGIRFPMAIVRGVLLGDGRVRVRYRFAGGLQDRAAGVMLHWQNEANYLLARANAAEDDLRIFRIVNGVRRTLPDGMVTGIPVDDDWHALEFVAEGPKLTASIDGTVAVVAYDTYLPAGRTGLWTKSDAVSDFADLEVIPAPESRG